MDVCSLVDEEDALRELPKGAQIVSIEDAVSYTHLTLPTILLV